MGAIDYYLDPGEAVGCRYCFDPGSPQLRAALRAPVPERVDGSALAEDLEWFRRLLEVGSAGYDRLAAHPEFDADEFFGRWSARLRAAAQQVRTREAVVDPMAHLQRLAPSSHLVLAGVGMSTPPARRVADSGPYTWATVGDTAVITLTTFQGFRVGVGAQLERFVADYRQHAARGRIVFDLRGNGGGRLDYMLRWIAQALCSDWQTYPYEEVLGAIAPCTRWNQTVEWQVRNETVASAEATAERGHGCRQSGRSWRPRRRRESSTGGAKDQATTRTTGVCTWRWIGVQAPRASGLRSTCSALSVPC